MSALITPAPGAAGRRGGGGRGRYTAVVSTLILRIPHCTEYDKVAYYGSHYFADVVFSGEAAQECSNGNHNL